MRRTFSTHPKMAAVAVVSLLTAGIALAQQATSPPDTGESRIGVIASIGCGIFARASCFVPHPFVIAGAIATCGFAFLDGLADPDSPSSGR